MANIPYYNRAGVTFEMLDAFKDSLREGDTIWMNHRNPDIEGEREIEVLCRVVKKYPNCVQLEFVKRGRKFTLCPDYFKVYKRYVNGLL